MIPALFQPTRAMHKLFGVDLSMLALIILPFAVASSLFIPWLFLFVLSLSQWFDPLPVRPGAAPQEGRTRREITAYPPFPIRGPPA